MAITVSSMIIKAGFDSTSVVNGLKRLSSGLKEVGKFSKGVHADFQRMVNTSGKLLSIFTGISVAGVGAFINLAKGAPAVAGAMAQITVQTERLKRSLGVALQPVFDKFAVAYTKFVNFVEANPDLTKNFVLSAGALAGIVALTKLIGVAAANPVALAGLALVGASFVGYKVAEGAINALESWLGTNKGLGYVDDDIREGSTLGEIKSVLVSILQGRPLGWEDTIMQDETLGGIKEEMAQPGYKGPGGTVYMSEQQTRRYMFLQWWDALWS